MRQHDHLPDNPNLKLDFSSSKLKEIYLAGGCFWGVEAYMAIRIAVCQAPVRPHARSPPYIPVLLGFAGY